MKMRDIIDIMEGATVPLSKPEIESIASHFVEKLLANEYWDDHAKVAYPSREFGTDLNEIIGDFEEYDDWPNALSGLSRPEIVKHPAFRKHLMRWAMARAKNVVRVVSRLKLTEGGYTVHRVMRVKSSWLKATKAAGKAALGVYWTYDLQGWNAEIGAYPIWAELKSGTNIMIHAVVPPDAVDWRYTVLAGMDYQSGDREFEMRLKSGATLNVRSVTNHDGGLALDVTGVAFTA